MVFDHGHHMMAVALWLFGDVRDGFARIERTESPAGIYDAPATLTWRHRDPPVHGMWDVSLALKMQLRMVSHICNTPVFTSSSARHVFSFSITTPEISNPVCSQAARRYSAFSIV